MCKIFLMAGIKKETNALAIKLVKAMADPMSRSNTDGLGYSAVKANGDMFGERWYINSRAFKTLPAVTSEDEYKEHLDMLGESIKPDKYTPIDYTNLYSKYGEVDLSSMTAITLHTRYATSGREFNNTHPFVDAAADTSLIHNGVIRNTSDFKFSLSTCDSESILIAYLKQNVGIDPTAVQAMANMLKGYYACGVFSRDANGNRVMDVFKSNASLSGAYIKELGVCVYTTSISDVEEVCSKIGLTVGPKFVINDGWFIRLDSVTGKVVCKMPFQESKEFEYTQTSYSKGQHGGHWSDDETDYYDNPYPYNRNKHVHNKGGGTIIDMTKPAVVERPIISLGLISFLKHPTHTKVYSAREVMEVNKTMREA